MATRVATADQKKVVGYLVVGAILLVIGAVLMTTGAVMYKPVLDVRTPADLRAMLVTERKRDALFGSGLALLTSGALMFFGFGATSVIADALIRRRELKKAVVSG